MKTRFFIFALLAVALCFYGCENASLDELMDTTKTSEEETDPDDGVDDGVFDNSDDNDGDMNNGESSDDEYDGGYFKEDGEGTAESPYTVSQVVKMLNDGEYDSEKGYYVKGIIAAIYAWDGNVGWMSYSISENGDYDDENFLYVSEGYGLGGERITSMYYLSEADRLIVYGNICISEDNGFEMMNSKIYYLDGEYAEDWDYSGDEPQLGDDDGSDDEDNSDDSSDDEGDDSDEDQRDDIVKILYTVSQIFEIIKNDEYDPEKVYCVQGIVASWLMWSGAGYMTYVISESGDYVNIIYESYLNIYEGYGLGGEEIPSPEYLSIGDEVVVYGKLVSTLEDRNIGTLSPAMIDGKLYSINGETKIDGGGDGSGDDGNDNPDAPSDDDGDDSSVDDNPDNPSGDDGNDGSGGDYDDEEDICQYMVDAYFKAYCLKYFDVNGDGKVSVSEAKEVTEIEINVVEDLTGIEYFPNLLSLSLSSYGKSSGSTAATIKYLDLSSNKKLVSIWFYKCSSLKTCILPEGLKQIDDSAFYGCTSLTSLSLPDSVTSIGDESFRGCSGLSSISLSNKLTSIGENAFRGAGLTSVIIPNSVAEMGEGAFWSCSNLETCTLSENLTKISSSAFRGSGLTSITIPNGVTKIGEEAFSYCSMMTSVIIPESVTEIESYAFNRSGLTSVTIPNSVVEMGENAFSYCSDLESCTLSENLLKINSYAFQYSGLISVTIPNGVTEIEPYAFYKCDSLVSISLPESLGIIGSYSFYTESKSVENAHYKIYDLKEVTVNAITPPECSSDSFRYEGTVQLTTLYVPWESIDAYKSSDKWGSKKFSQILAIPL